MTTNKTNGEVHDFICVDNNDSTLADSLNMEKNKKLYEIRKGGKRLWIKCENITVRYSYSNQYGKQDGTFGITGDESFVNAVSMIDHFVLEEFHKLYGGKIIDNTVMTDNTINTMFRSSLFNDILKVSVNETNCAFFKSDATLMKNPDLRDILREKVTMATVIEPAFAWVFQGKIGIRWNCRQVRLQKITFNTQKKSLFFNSNEGKIVVNEVKKTLPKSNLPAVGSFKNIFQDSDEEEDITSKEKVIPDKQMTTPKKKYTMLLDDNDDE